jgi:hypothetical protein
VFLELVLAAVITPAAPTSPSARAEVARRLERATVGLLVRSETDAPITVVSGGAAPSTGLTKAFVLERFGFAPGTPVRMKTLYAFLTPHMRHWAWHTRAEARTVYRFRRLAVVLQRTLRSVRVFEIGDRVKDVLVLGVTPTGECVGLRTIVVET